MKRLILYIIPLLTLAACSTTSGLEGSEQLYTGLLPIEYNSYEPNSHQSVTKDEIEASLAAAPSGALFGSSYYRTPIPYSLWIWNSCNRSNGAFKKWLNKSFGKAPVLISNVNPALRTSIAKTVLENNGYFNGAVDYTIVEGEPETTKWDTIPKPHTAKIKYNVSFGKLFTIDSISHSNYPEEISPLIFGGETFLRKEDPFSVSNLDNERTRIYNTLRNHGYYYYKNSYTSYLADTLQVPGKVQLQLHCADSLPDEALRKWVIGKTTIQIQRTSRETLTDTLTHRHLTIRFGGNKSPLRPRVLLADMKLRPGDIFSQDKYQESLNNLSAKGIYSTAEIAFTPRLNEDGTFKEVPDSILAKNGEERAGAGILDMTVNAVLDKPYDVTFQANVKGKTNNRLGPGVMISLSKRNAFRGGELLSLSAGANYEFQMGGGMSLGNSYDFSANISLQMPRLLWIQPLIPKFFFKNNRRRWYTTPSTSIVVSGETVRRAGMFNRNILSASLDYIMQPSPTSIHKFTPLSITYGQTVNKSQEYLDKISKSAYAMISALDELIPKLRYTYIYTSPATYRNPIFLELSVAEAGNLTNLIGMLVSKKKWDDKGKTLFSTPFSQFIKFEASIRKTWDLGGNNSLVAHATAGYIHAYGNNINAPFSERMYIGGANDMRGFAVRNVGPGSLHIYDTNIGYAQHNGDLKIVGNLEYRPRLFGSLYGAIFMDFGNVWVVNRTEREDIMTSLGSSYGDPAKFDIAIDAGIGLRYDLDFFVLRLDWGFALHTPYDTGRSGFFNFPAFHRMQCLNLAIGYPF